MRISLDEAAWASRWRHRSVAERAGLALGLALWGLLAPTWWVGTGVLLIIMFVALCVAQVPPPTYLRAVAAPWAFVLLGVVAVAVGIGPAPEALVTLGHFHITTDTLGAATLILGRAFSVTAAVVLLAATCPMSELLSALRRIRIPGILVDIAAATYRMIFGLLDRATTIRQAQTARLGYESVRNSFRSLGQLSATVFISAWHRARRLEDGLTGRGGTGELVALRTANPTTPRFVAAVLVFNAAAAILVVAGWWWR